MAVRSTANVNHARKIKKGAIIVVSPGVAVRHDTDEHGVRHAVAVVYGGYAKSLDLEAVVAAARLALKDWPEVIDRMEIVAEGSFV